MALSITRTSTENVSTITLSGELDGASAPQLRDDVDKALESQPKHLVLMVKDLEYIASAGIRVIVYAKQKSGTGVDIYVVGAQAQVVDTLQKTGVDRSVYLVDTYDPASANG
jgi:anti-anti-sigma factor